MKNAPIELTMANNKRNAATYKMGVFLNWINDSTKWVHDVNDNKN